MHRSTSAALALTSLLILGPTTSRLSAQEAPDGLAAFGDLFVGTWEADDSRHVVEWGVGDRLIKTKSYFRSGADWRLVSEGVWFWDADQNAVRGVTVAIDMPVHLFEYTSRVGGTTVVHDFVAQGEMGGRFVERWIFGDESYEWTLEQDGTRLAGGSYRRVRSR